MLTKPIKLESGDLNFSPYFVYVNGSSEGSGESWESSGRVLDSRPNGPGFEAHQRHCVVVLEQDTFILAQEDPSLLN